MPLKRDPSRRTENDAIMSAVCRYVCRGLRPAEIVDLLHNDFSQRYFSSQVVFDLISNAARKGWLRFESPPHRATAEKIGSHFNIEEYHVTVTTSSALEDVANHGAKALYDFLQSKRKESRVRVGFSGGLTMRLIVRRLAQLLAQPVEKGALPGTVVFHSLSGGFDETAAGSDPTAFLTYLTESAIAQQIKTEFVLLHAPPIIRPEQSTLLSEIPAIAYAKRQAKDLDLIMTSVASFDDDHSMLRKYLERYGSSAPSNGVGTNPELGKALKKLIEAGCRGDMLWLPFNEKGPIDTRDHPFRTMTLLELEDVQQFVKSGRDVILVAGPCPGGGSRCSKAPVLKILLGLNPRLFTRLVLDYSTATALLAATQAP
jgi:DNA-binding transcriptional regulator LsrR (DeoR family)